MDITNLLNHSTKKPKAVLRIVISVSIGLLVLWIFLVSRMELPGQRDSVLVSASDSTQQMLDVKKELLGEQDATPGVFESSTEQPPMFQNAFTTFMVMVTMLGGLWAWSMRKKKRVPDTPQDIKEIAQHVIGQGVQLKVIELNEEVWVLGVSANSVNLLHRYPKKDWQLPKALDPEPELSGSDFNSIFKLLGN